MHLINRRFHCLFTISSLKGDIFLKRGGRDPRGVHRGTTLGSENVNVFTFLDYPQQQLQYLFYHFYNNVTVSVSETQLWVYKISLVHNYIHCGENHLACAYVEESLFTPTLCLGQEYFFTYCISVNGGQFSLILPVCSHMAKQDWVGSKCVKSKILARFNAV